MIRLHTIPKVCVAVGDADPDEMFRLVSEASERRESFVELRLDMLDDPTEGPALVDRIQRSLVSLLVLATCRRKEAQGGFAGSVGEQRMILEAAIAAGAQMVDVEIESAEHSPEIVTELKEKARVVLSYHNFEKTPALNPILKRLRRHPADVYKIAVQAVKFTDNLKLLQALKGADVPLVVLGMGEAGGVSRVLSPSRGATFTFAAPDSASGTAPGQFSASQMRNAFQAHRLKATSRVYGVVADPVEHSLSPALHNRAFRRRRTDACYLPFRVEPKLLKDFFTLVRDLPIDGLSVTIPHKQAVMSHLDSVDDLSAKIGAVNTVYRKGAKLCGSNTDVAGVVVPLGKRMALKGAKVLIHGYGGAARAAAFALIEEGSEITLTGRNLKKAETLAKDCGASVLSMDEAVKGSFDALIQAAPVGMYPNVLENPFPDEIPAEVVFDMVYNPLETVLLRTAASKNKQVIEGVEMFLEQAVAQFELWTGDKAPRVTMRNAVLEVLTGISPT